MSDRDTRRPQIAPPRAFEGASIFPVFPVNRPLPRGTATPARATEAQAPRPTGGRRGEGPR